MEEKLAPWMQPIYDNLEFIMKSQMAYQKVIDEGFLKLESLTYIRGRSIPNQFMIIDEAQNLTKHEMKTIISRAGEGTKIVFTGDTDQIDNPMLDSGNNGLSYVIEKFKDESIAAHVKLEKCVRSELADRACELLQ
jgi:PhoH-like ATPase